MAGPNVSFIRRFHCDCTITAAARMPPQFSSSPKQFTHDPPPPH